MRNTPNLRAEKFRITTGPMGSDASYGNNGAFEIVWGGRIYHAVISDGEGWDHVSISLRDRCPTWEEMCYFKDMFFKDDETVVQYHPPKDDHRNAHEHCLHMWRPTNVELPRPPGVMVAPKTEAEFQLAERMYGVNLRKPGG